MFCGMIGGVLVSDWFKPPETFEETTEFLLVLFLLLFLTPLLFSPPFFVLVLFARDYRMPCKEDLTNCFCIHSETPPPMALSFHLELG